MPASIVELAEWVKDRITDIITPASGSPVAIVARRWSVPSTDKDLGKMPAGRKVEVWHTTYGTGADVTRELASHTVTLTILVAERYIPDSGAGGEPDNDWIDALVAWVETNIYNPLTATGDESTDPAQLILGAWWTQNVEMVSVCDPDILRAHNVFWSEIAITFSTEN